VTTAKRIRSSRSQTLRASRAHRPPHLVDGTWRSRVQHRPEPGGGGGGRAKSAPLVLLVDDEQAIRTICRINLEGDGFSVLEAKDGAEALAEIRRQRPSLVLLDVMMPGVDGWDVARRLGADPSTREIPVVFLTARAEASDRRHAQHLGGVGYIVKPFDPVKLGELIEDVLTRIERGERVDLQREITEEHGEKQ
jgi:two-component system phosphate regulon response regulator PhoB